MRHHFVAVMAVLLVGFSDAKICKNITIPVKLSASTAVFNLPPLISNPDATTFIQNLTQPGQNFTDVVLAGYKTTAGLYNIRTEFCSPSEALSQDPTVQILTHGLGFDKGLVNGNL